MLERIYIEIGNICNLSCSFCPSTTRARRQMSVAEFCEVCKRISGKTKCIYLHVMGEPLLHPKLDRLLQVARDYALPVCITTNGTLLARRGSLLLDYADIIHKVSISLHCIEGNEGAGMSMNEYLDSCISFSRAAAGVGIYNIFRLWNLDSGEGSGANAQNKLIEQHLKLEFADEWVSRWSGYRLAKNIFLEYAGIFTWPTDSQAEAVEEGFCHGLSAQIAILADGSVVPCCLDSEGKIPLGNIFDQELDTILSSPRAKAMSDGFACGKLTEPLCQSCTYARRFKRRNDQNLS